MSEDSRAGTGRDLRYRAEKRLPREEGVTAGALSERDKDALIHELRVHQIELEIQNEELRHAQQELGESRDAYLHLYNKAPVGYLTIDRNGIIRRYNDTVLELMGDDSVDLRDRPFHSLLSEETRSQFLARFRSFFSRPEGKNLEVQLGTGGAGNETARDVRLTGRSTGAGREGETQDLLLAMTDITQQKQSERRIQALLREKELLVREVHHRVKNNLNSVMSMLNLQTMHTPEPAAQEAIQAASSRVRTMYAIYELLQEGAQDFREVDLRDYLTILLSRIIEATPGPRLVQQLVSVRATTRQAVSLGIILNELIADACEHAFPGGAGGKEQIIVSLEIAEPGRLALTVEDNGVGMTREAAESTGGFGLLLVRSQVEQLRGTFAHESAHPGTRFLINVPLESH